MPVDQTLQWRRHRTQILVLGASGRLGRALGHRICCEKRAARLVEVIWQTRQTCCMNARAPGTTLIWDILNEDAPVDLRVDIVLCLAGVVPHSAANLALNSDLAQSALDVGHRSGANHVFLISLPQSTALAHLARTQTLNPSVPTGAPNCRWNKWRCLGGQLRHWTRRV
jgi:hypothetical protein